MAVFFIGKKTVVSIVRRGLQGYQIVYPTNAFLIRLLLRLNKLISKGGLFFMQLMEVFDRPILESFGNLNARKEMVNLLVELLSAHASLHAGAIFAFGAMVIRVMKKLGLLHFVNLGLTTRAGVLATVSKLETAIPAPELVLFFGSDHAIALAATDQSCEREDPVRLRTRVTFAAQELLHAVIFCLRHHRFVVAFVPPTAFLWVFKGAVVKGYCEDLVNGTLG